MPGDDESATCWLCHRPIGDSIEWHHPVPRAKKGRATVPIHPICHRTIHAHFTNSQLARIGDDRDQLAQEPAVARFIEWIADKPPDFHAPTRGGPARGGRVR